MNIEKLYSLYLRAGKVSTDTRNIPIKSLYFALKGANFNGNEFAVQAIASGASFAIVDEKQYEDESNYIYYVEDALTTLQKLAQYHRSQLKIPIIALTGSNGKTTTKELITAVLSQKYNVLATNGNLNNHIGVPLTLLSINSNHEIAVVEIGANHQKEIEFLCEIAQPDFGYITNFGKAHLEGFGGIQGVIKGKSELYTYLKENQKTVFVNTDDSLQVELTKGLDRITFGTNDKTDYQFQVNENKSGNCPEIRYQGTSFQSKLVGNYNASNVAAAIAIGLKFEVPLECIKSGIENYQADNNRSQVINLKDKQIILDAYNANPSSMEAALLNFSKLKGEKTVILGDMFELGEETEKEHKRIADLAIELQFENIFLIGNYFSKIDSNGNENLAKFNSLELAEVYFKNFPIEDKTILIKGSRGMALEKVLEFI
ncbi:UDP-N-acetylmuramoyl-tripeptide--D-alanyl-D-alanine ligase [Moheibacter sediminis]|uniref:UDP-N-acetylmuramoyl-tripeptide--D-alanyl-D-alanine ligase n=1 Tax=Moheibacter sediminis TaxID=1434700 RepID=A0A1W1ZNP3_9FLAO|nr:UDP-N-acetylmuramoyl-tripeptide--D-alanyl-D-alanine ligase [Moheibacter sediminis]SMC49977.1 UDP-N-acetylmuramoyl-tripeptide--D-alanyl-D-alanine ligase [Moheibacter sediminis]